MGDLARTAIYGVVKLALDKLTPKGRVGALAAGGRWLLRLLNLGSGYASSAHLTLVLAGASGHALWSLLGGAAWFCALHLLGRRYVVPTTRRPLLVGVCGVSCSGKSTVATELARALNNDPHASALCQDDSFDYDSFATNACPQRAVTDGSESTGTHGPCLRAPAL